MNDRTRKGWQAPTWEGLGVVHRGGSTFFLPNGEKVYDDGRDVWAPFGKERRIWPDPEDQPGEIVVVVEGRADVISAAELRYPVVGVPSASYRFKDGEAERIAAGRHRVYVVADSDAPGRKGARQRALELAEERATFLVDLWPDRDDGKDLGDVLAGALRQDAAGGADLARYYIDGKLEDAEHVYAASVDAEPVVAADDAQASGRAPWPASLHDDAFHGIAGDFVRTVAPHSEADPAALLVLFLAAFGAMLEGKAGWSVEGTSHGPRIWPLLVGNTASGRKGTATGRVRQIMELADPGWWREHKRAGLASGEGIVWHVRDPIVKRRRPRKGEKADADGDGMVTVMEDAGVKDKRLLVVEGEFAHVLAVMRREGNTLSTTLRELWDHGSYGGMTKNDPVTTTDAHVVVIGHVTGRELRERLTDTDAANGFGNRFVVVCARRARLLPFGGNLEPSSLSLLAGRVRDALAGARAMDGAMAMTGPAADLWRRAYGDLCDGGDDLLGTMTARAATHVVRFAVTYALIDASRAIDTPHLRAALAVWRYCEDSAAHVFGGKTGDALADRLLAMMNAAGENGITRGELRDGISHDIPTDRVDLALTHLERCLFARRERGSSGKQGGRPPELWYAEPGGNPGLRDETSGASGSIPESPVSSRSDGYGEDDDVEAGR